MAIAKLIFQVRMSIKYHQTTFAFQISHKLRHTILWRNTYQHVYVVYHQVSFGYLDSFVITQLPQDFSSTVNKSYEFMKASAIVALPVTNR